MPTVSVDRTANMPDYAQNIFLFQPEAGEDPRNVFPRVYEGLRKIGQVVHVAGETRDQLGNTENTIIERTLDEVRRKLLE